MSSINFEHALHVKDSNVILPGNNRPAPGDVMTVDTVNAVSIEMKWDKQEKMPVPTKAGQVITASGAAIPKWVAADSIDGGRY